MKFLLLTSKLFLTYKHCNEISTKTILHKYFINFFSKRKANLQTLITAFEDSDSEHSYKHYHVFIKLDRKIKIDNSETLDVYGVHGEYQSVRNAQNTVKYVTKDKDYLIDGNEQYLYPKSHLSSEQLMQFVINKVVQLKTWLRYKKFRDLHPKALINVSVSKLNLEDQCRYRLRSELLDKKILDVLYSTYPHLFQRCKIEPLNSFNVPKEIVHWAKHEKTIKTLVVIGPSGIGKTELSKALSSNPLVVSHIDQLKELKVGEHDCVIFDDMNFSHWTRENMIHLTDLSNDRGINVKGDYATLPAGLKRIITSNKKPHELFPKWFDASINRRIFIVEIGVCMWIKTTEWK